MRALAAALIAIGVLCSNLLLPAAAAAQRRPPRAPEQPVEAAASPRDAEARNLYEAGRLAFDDGRFEEALTNFRRAFELSDRGELLYNIGVAADRLRRDQEALDAYEQFLLRSPETPQRRNVEARIRVLRLALIQATPPQPSIGAAEIPVQTGPREGSVREASATITPTVAATRGAEVYETWWFWTIVGVVVAGAVVVGVVVANPTSQQPPFIAGDFGNVVFTLRGP